MEKRRRELIEIRKDDSQKQLALGSLRQKIDSLNLLISNSVCPTCGQRVPNERKVLLDSEIIDLKKELENKNINQEKFLNALTELNHLNKINFENTVERLRRITNEEDKNNLEIGSIDSRLEKIKTLIQSDDSSLISKLHIDRDNLHLQIINTKAKIKELSSSINVTTDNINRTSRLISGSAQSKNLKSTKDVKCYSDLVDVFSQAIDILRSKLKNAIQVEASRVFKNLTTENQYKGLKINERYGLTIIDKDGQPVSIRSAGAEQIVAYSFICALNNTANKPAPVVIDTPFGRLDLKHRKNIITHIPEIAEQIIILVHEGEINRDTDLEPIGDRIGSIYDITRISSSQSQLINSKEG